MIFSISAGRVNIMNHHVQKQNNRCYKLERKCSSVSSIFKPTTAAGDEKLVNLVLCLWNIVYSIFSLYRYLSFAQKIICFPIDMNIATSIHFLRYDTCLHIVTVISHSSYISKNFIFFYISKYANNFETSSESSNDAYHNRIRWIPALRNCRQKSKSAKGDQQFL